MCASGYNNLGSVEGGNMESSGSHRALELLVYLTMLTLAGCGGSSSSLPLPSPSSSTYMVGGTVAGLSSSESVTLLNNGGDALTVGGNGTFSFSTSLGSGSAYAITVQSHTPGVSCSVSNGSGTVGASNVTNISVSCAAGTERILYSFGWCNRWGGPGGGFDHGQRRKPLWDERQRRPEQ